MKYLFLDDHRLPAEAANYINPADRRPFYRKEQWVIVRSYPEFCDTIANFGVPEIVSLDHDLDETFIPPMKGGNIDYLSPLYENEYSKTGYHCLEWLGKFVTEKGNCLPLTWCHSQSFYGYNNIMNLYHNLTQILSK